MRVLVAEDSVELAAQLRDALAAAHFAVDVAPDGEEALFLGETEPYDAVVLDLGLPRLDGLSVLRRWRAAGRGMPVLILTARDSWTEKVAGLDAGADDYLAKPFAMAELLARLRALVRRAHGRAQAEIAVGELLHRPCRRQRRAARHAGAADRAGIPPAGLSGASAGPARLKTELTEHLYAQDFDRDSNTLRWWSAGCAASWMRR